MNRRVVVAAAVVAAVVVSSMFVSLRAQPKTPGNDQIRFYGYAGYACSTWTAEHEKKSVVAALFDQWVYGFVSGYAYGSHERMKVVEGEALVAAVSTWCAENPKEALATAARALVGGLH